MAINAAQVAGPGLTKSAANPTYFVRTCHRKPCDKLAQDDFILLFNMLREIAA
jgi:hypothetical protein